MPKIFNTTADCKPDFHYMVNLDKRLAAIKRLVDSGAYFTINRARQYGKTTILRALSRFLEKDYYIVLMDFQAFGAEEFAGENTFSLTFARSFIRLFKRNPLPPQSPLHNAVSSLDEAVQNQSSALRLQRLFEYLADICAASDRKIVLMIDEVDSASSNQVFLDFLSQLRAYYIDRDLQPTFHSVILASVYDIRNLRRKLRPEDEHKVNSPWNIAADFNVEMSFSPEDIAGMLTDYEADYCTGMDINAMARQLYAYTSGYPYLVSRLCKLMDEQVLGQEDFSCRAQVWTKNGLNEAIKLLLTEKNTLFESLSEKLLRYPDLNNMLRTLLFTGKSIVYNEYEPSINIASMFGLVKNQNGSLTVANRIFETWLYNLYLSSSEMQSTAIYSASLLDKNQFVSGGQLNMRLILEKFILHFHELYGGSSETFIEEEGRKYFLLYLRPIINGTGNYYIEARTRNLKRTDIIVDYCGQQYIIELKIWHGEEYNRRGEQQLADYLEEYHQKTGYLLSFNFNQKKTIGIREIVIGDKLLIEGVV